ncbi:hypothetical protein PR202_ga25092 [Eleusine coracana subsp. coracana]|uniref:Uncharacterized protein n=1 Tax=Eleusine coracana subsp. coracana TaxID=191504 RepID=A0AAV5D8L3_ELECO|nr:hypothetical protein QOZ80_9AG0671100 [Eleusine coracana subsp. coracana]GJN07273.1 hypothetical protein PR202_ga25092 [Eleusine coracana subsp. coracana]
MLTKVISSDSISGAVEQILDELKEDERSSSGRHNVIYFDGWDGLGASAVLRAVGQAAASQENQHRRRGLGLEFSHIFHIDCSKWVSRRAMQRVIAEQLKLPVSVMELMDAQDVEDDYQGVSKRSRAEMPQVSGAIYEHIIQKLAMNRRFLVIFHNGSNEELDLNSFGFPLSGYSRNKVLWSFQGRFRAFPKTKVDRALRNARVTTTDVVISAATSPPEKNSIALEWEAEDVQCEIIKFGGTYRCNLWAAESFFLLMLRLRGMGNHFDDYDLATHGFNYWVCEDSHIKLRQKQFTETDDPADTLWRSCDALYQEMRLDEEYYRNPRLPSSVFRSFLEIKPYWSSPTYGFMRVLISEYERFPKDMFQNFNLLSVLKLSACTFHRRSPPFLCCDRLRFLHLDHCIAVETDFIPTVAEDTRQFLQRLWVLDVRYSKGAFLVIEEMEFMTQLRELIVMGERPLDEEDLQRPILPNIRRLRVKDSSLSRIVEQDEFPERSSETVVLSGRDKMELLEFSGVHVSGERRLSVESSLLETIILTGPTDMKEISLTGCAKLKNLFLSESFPDLGSICIAGTALETLDLSTVMAPKLYGLYLLHCTKLCAILWPPLAEGKRKRYLDKLHVDTTQKEGANTTAISENHTTGREFDWHICARDARILRSLEPVKDYFGPNDALVEILSPSHCDVDTGSGQQHVQVKLNQLMDTAKYADVVVNLMDINRKQEQGTKEGSSNAPAIMCICPSPPSVPSQGCYIHIQDNTSRTRPQAASITLPGFICDGTKVLHVHDSLHIIRILTPTFTSTAWNKLEWCRVEECPKLECVFSPELVEVPEGNDIETVSMFKKLRVTWASHLLNARYIWKCSVSSEAWLDGGTFADLTLLHLYCCPRMIHVLHCPLPMDMDEDMDRFKTFDRLETLEIMWCGDLSVAFHFNNTAFELVHNSSASPTYIHSPAYDVLASELSDFQNYRIWFPKLKHIYLHELPQLRNICNNGLLVSAPELETIKIRGCWSLRILPIVWSNNVVQCDCEKEWWSRLKWESEEHASHYKPIHPRYYKKTILRGSVLR